MSNQPPDLNQAYRTWQGAHTTEASIMEGFMNTINALNEEKLELNADIIKLRARVMELEKPVKKLDKVTETVPKFPPGTNPPKPKK